MEEDGLFNSYAKQHLPLSNRLRGYADTLRNRLNAMRLDEVTELTRDDVVQVIADIRCKPVELGDSIANWAGPAMSRTYYAAVAIIEGEELIHFWPDDVDGIEPIDAVDTTASEQWKFGVVGGSPTGVGIITTIQLSEDEHGREVDKPTLPNHFTARVDVARRYVEALAEQIQRFFDTTLVDLAMGIVSERKVNRAIAGNLGFPSTWKIDAPKIITEPPTPAAQPDDQQTGPAVQTPAVPADDPPATGHVVPYRHRLDPASFEDVQRVTRIWANSLERYPAAYSPLEEDRISDLLAATLNATLPAAHREVYSRGGKSDIYISADVLAEGSSPAKIFICESKWAKSKRWVMKAVDPQLYGYLTTHDTSAMLLLLFRQQRYKSSRSNAHNWLQAINGYVREESSSVQDWPIFVYVHGPYEVRLCVASVHLPPTNPATD